MFRGLIRVGSVVASKPTHQLADVFSSVELEKERVRCYRSERWTRALWGRQFAFRGAQFIFAKELKQYGRWDGRAFSQSCRRRRRDPASRESFGSRSK